MLPAPPSGVAYGQASHHMLQPGKEICDVSVTFMLDARLDLTSVSCRRSARFCMTARAFTRVSVLMLHRWVLHPRVRILRWLSRDDMLAKPSSWALSPLFLLSGAPPTGPVLAFFVAFARVVANLSGITCTVYAISMSRYFDSMEQTTRYRSND